MDVLNSLAQGFSLALTMQNLLWCFVGVTLGTAVGVLPGIGPAVTVALLLPVRYGLALLVAAFGALWLYEHRVLGTRLLPAEYLRLRRSLTLVVCSLLSLGLVAFG